MHLRAVGTHGAGLALTRRYETIRCAAKSGRAADLLLIELADTTLVRLVLRDLPVYTRPT